MPTLWHCDKAIESAPDYAFAYANKAGALCDSGRFDEAIEACHKALKLSPHPDTFNEVHNNLGTALGFKGKYEEAKQEFDSVLSNDPKNIAALLRLARFQEKEGHTAQAIYNLDRVLAINPDYPAAKLALRRILEGMPAQAIRHNSEVLQKNPDDEQTADQIGRSLIRLGNYDGAISFYYDVLARRPQDTFTRTQLGKILVLRGRTDDGIRELEDVLRVDPNNKLALNAVAWIRATHPFSNVRNGKRSREIRGTGGR